MKTKPFSNFLKDISVIYHDEVGKVIADPANLDVPYYREDIEHKLEGLRDEYERILEGNIKSISQLENWVENFLHFYKLVFNTEYPHKDKLYEDIQKYKKTLK